MSRLRTELTQGGKCIGRLLLMVERICGMSIVDYVKTLKIATTFTVNTDSLFTLCTVVVQTVLS